MYVCLGGWGGGLNRTSTRSRRRPSSRSAPPPQQPPPPPPPPGRTPATDPPRPGQAGPVGLAGSGERYELWPGRDGGFGEMRRGGGGREGGGGNRLRTTERVRRRGREASPSGGRSARPPRGLSGGGLSRNGSRGERGWGVWVGRGGLPAGRWEWRVELSAAAVRQRRVSLPGLPPGAPPHSAGGRARRLSAPGGAPEPGPRGRGPSWRSAPRGATTRGRSSPSRPAARNLRTEPAAGMLCGPGIARGLSSPSRPRRGGRPGRLSAPGGVQIPPGWPLPFHRKSKNIRFTASFKSAPPHPPLPLPRAPLSPGHSRGSAERCFGPRGNRRPSESRPGRTPHCGAAGGCAGWGARLLGSRSRGGVAPSDPRWAAAPEASTDPPPYLAPPPGCAGLRLLGDRSRAPMAASASSGCPGGLLAVARGVAAGRKSIAGPGGRRRPWPWLRMPARTPPAPRLRALPVSRQSIV